MDLVKQLLKDHSKNNCKRIVDYVGFDKNRFKELFHVFLKGPYRVTQRAAWPISYCVEEHPELIKPHLNALLSFAAKPDVSVAVKRNTCRLLQFSSIPTRLQGKAASLCFSFLQDKSETVAVKVFAMSTLANIATAQPSLKNELKIIVEDLLPYSSSGFRSRATKVLKQLN